MKLRDLVAEDAPEDPVLGSIELPAGFETVARLLAVGVVVIAAAGSVLVADGDDRVNVVGTLLCAVPWLPWLAGRMDQFPTRWIAAASLVTIAALAAPDVLNGDDTLGFGPQFSMVFPIVVLVAYVMSPRREVTLVAAAVTAVILIRALASPEPVYALSGWILPLLLSFAGIAGIRSGALEIARGQQLLASLEAENERRELAQEVHAAVAHTLGVTLKHVATARTAIQLEHSGQAAAALEEAESHGRSSLADVRRIIRLLRGADDSSLDSVQPRLADVDQLVADYRSAGWPVSLQVDGDLASVPSTVGLAGYRLLQEAIANAARHGIGPAQVRVRLVDAHVEANVTNMFRPHPQRGRPGAGIARMRERASAVGGTLAVAAVDGRWVVDAHLPCWEVEPA